MMLLWLRRSLPSHDKPFIIQCTNSYLIVWLFPQLKAKVLPKCWQTHFVDSVLSNAVNIQYRPESRCFATWESSVLWTVYTGWVYRLKQRKAILSPNLNAPKETKDHETAEVKTVQETYLQNFCAVIRHGRVIFQTSLYLYVCVEETYYKECK